MIDTHTHLNFKNYDADRGKVIGQCRSSLEAAINVGIDLKTSQESLQLAQANEFIYAAVGFHPHESNKLDSISVLKLLLSNPKVAAIGEIGLDYSDAACTIQDVKIQQQVFHDQVELALQTQLPMIIHCREAFDDTYRILKQYQSQSNFRGVWHSFTQGKSDAWKVLDLGLYIGINGILTYASAPELQTAVIHLPLDRILLETDAPFLTPDPPRKQTKRNEPWMIKWVADKIASLKKLPIEEIDQVTSQNARQLFSTIPNLW